MPPPVIWLMVFILNQEHHIEATVYIEPYRTMAECTDELDKVKSVQPKEAGMVAVYKCAAGGKT